MSGRAGRGAVGALATALVALSGARSPAATFYVRTDGGTPVQCTGLADAAYPGSGSGQACAWGHPFHALPPGAAPRIAGGDTLVIGPGAYRMGLGAPGAEACDADAAWDCHMPPVPGGSAPSQPTRIVGAGWEAGCPARPQLWGAERPWRVLNLADASNVEVACLEVTDHSGCVESHSGGLACERETPPFGDWAPIGLYAEDSSNVVLRDLDIHGLAAAGVHAGRLTDWTVERVRLAGNGWAGWDGDIDGDDGNLGTLHFTSWTVEWNGCAETYPGLQPAGCWAQTAGGYGDGVGTGETGGHWLIEDSAFRYNTSDGLDLLYVRRSPSQIEIRRTLAVGNAGNQIKTAGPAVIENTIAVGNCGFFDGQPFTHHVDDCRAAGNTLSLDLSAGQTATVTNSTVTGEGDCLVLAGCTTNCAGTATVRLRNNVFEGQTDFLQPFEDTCLAWAEGFSESPFDIDYSVVNGTKDAPPCPGAHDLCGVPAGLRDSSLDSFDAHLLPTSPAIDAGTSSGAPAHDFDGRPRGPLVDIGAYEWRPAGADLDGDGHADLVWRHATSGQAAVWLMDGPAVRQAALLPLVPAEWQVAGLGDLDGDGRADLVWRNATTGEDAVWFMHGATIAGATFLPWVSPPWAIAGLGDLDGDGRSDLLWRSPPTGENAVWLMQGAAVVSAAPTWTLPGPWEVAGLGDLDGDGRADVVWRSATTGENAAWLMDGLAPVAAGSLPAVAVPWEIGGIGDLDDAAGGADLLWRNATTGESAAWFMDGAAVVSAAPLATLLAPWQLAAQADLDGDGRADLLWRHTTTGADAVWLMNGAAIASAAFTTAVADLDWTVVAP